MSVSAFPGYFVEKAAEEFWGSYTFGVFFETALLSSESLWRKVPAFDDLP